MARRFLLLLLPLLALAASDAWAHVALKRSIPAEGGHIPAGDITVELHFSGRVDAQRSRLTLLPAGGSPRTLTPEPAETPDGIRAQAQAVPQGPCQLRYDILATDGHLVSGVLTFTADGF